MSETMEKQDIEGKDIRELWDQTKTLSIGTDPIDLKGNCLELCQQYISGKWMDMSVEDIEVKRLTSGLGNQTYRCNIKDRDDNEPHDVVIRIYGLQNRIDFKTLELCDNQIDESVVTMMADQIGVGPQVYGLFGSGLIMKYYPHRHFTINDLYDQDLLRQLASKIAQFHAIKLPLTRTENKVKNYLIYGSQKTVERIVEKRELFTKYNFNSLLDFEFKSEIDWVLDKIEGIVSPIVFSHNDFRVDNTLITENKRIVLSDFDISGYFNRGFDFAAIFSTFDNSGEDLFEFKDESVVKEFIRFYIKENEKLFGKQFSENKCNSIENIVLEAKVFSLFHTLFCALFLLDTEFWGFPLTEKTYLFMANMMINRYLFIKTTLLAQNILSI